MDDNSEFPISTGDIRLRRELVGAGWRDRDILRAMKAGLITRVRYGAYVDARLWGHLSTEADHHRARARAVLRTAHPSSVLTHQSALAELEVPMWRLPLDDVAITRTDGVAGRREAGIVHHSGTLPLSQLTVRNGVPVSSAARTAVEILSTTDAELGFCILNALLNLRRTTIEEVQHVAAQTQHWPNTLGVRLALGLADPRLGSIAESRTFHLFYREGVPLPEPQVEVFDETGMLVGIVDFLWRRQGVFLEFDGRLKYERFRRPGESLDEYVMREKRREERICQATGWICIRIGWSDLSDSQRLARRVLAILARRTTSVA